LLRLLINPLPDSVECSAAGLECQTVARIFDRVGPFGRKNRIAAAELIEDAVRFLGMRAGNASGLSDDAM
jgi:hypothetical protein